MADEEKDVMDELNAQWNKDMTDAGTMALKEGPAVLKVINSFVNRARSSGRKQTNWQCEVVSHESDPGSAGSKVIIRYGLEKVEDIKRLNTALVNLGLEIVKQPSDILRANREVVGVHFNGIIKPQDDPQYGPNVYINPGARRKDLEGGVTGASPATAEPGARF